MKAKKKSIKWALKIFSTSFSILNKIFPSIAVSLAKSIFFTPIKFAPHFKELEWINSCVKYNIIHKKNEIRVLCWKPLIVPNNRRVLLIHGWSGRASQMGYIASELSKKGFLVDAFDAAGHGKSTGKQTNMIGFAEIIANLSQKNGVYDVLIGHSLGGVAAVYYAKNEGFLGKVITINSPSNIFKIMESFSQKSGISRVIARKVLAKIGADFGVNVEDISAENMVEKIACKGLIFQDMNDTEVSWDQGLRMYLKWPNSELKLTQNLGHITPLRSGIVMKEIARFVID